MIPALSVWHATRPFLILSCLMLCLVPDASALVFTVNSQGDDADQEPLDNLCWTGAFVVTSQGSELECTIRAAIEQSNAFAGDDVVEFGPDLSQTADTTTFSPSSPLPPITDSLVIDGTSAFGYDAADPWAIPIVQINGAVGLVADLQGTDAVTIRAVAVYNSTGHGIQATLGGTSSLAIEGSHIGVSRGGFQLGNGGDGIYVVGAGENTTTQIGLDCNTDFTVCSGKGNLVAANLGTGVNVIDAPSEIHGNRIGTDRLGSTTFVAFGGATPNGGWGIQLNDSLSGDSRVNDNLVSGNEAGGIHVVDGQAVLTRNRIGTNANGTAALPNEGLGVLAEIDIGIGDTLTEGSGNLISGNLGGGVRCSTGCTVVYNTIGMNLDLSAPLGNHGVGVFHREGLNGAITHNTIAGNVGPESHGILVIDSQSLQIGFNYIGTTPTGGNFGNPLSVGILSAGDLVEIGGNGSAGGEFGNVIGNHLTGISLRLVEFEGLLYAPDTHVIQSNFIGTTKSGDDIGNIELGISVGQISDFAIGIAGEKAATQANVVGYNGAGIGVIGGGPGVSASVAGNYIGTNSAGDNLGNSGRGVIVYGWEAKIGAPDPEATISEINEAANIIAFNSGNGIELPLWTLSEQSYANSFVGNVIHSNGGEPIDLNADGPTPNDIGDVDDGTNRLLNTPEFDVNGVVLNPATAELDIRYRVDTPVSPLTPLIVHFYYASDDPGVAPMVYLGYHSYPATAAGGFVDISLPLPAPVPYLADLAATSTNASDGTSEMVRVAVPEPTSVLGLAVGVFGLVGCSCRRKATSSRRPGLD